MTMPTRLIKDAAAFGYKADDGLLEARSYHLLEGKSDPFYDLVTRGTLRVDELIEEAELDSQFYYTATQFKIVRDAFHNRKVASEQGLGTLSLKDGRYIFNRTRILATYAFQDDGTPVKSGADPQPYGFSNDDFFTIYAHAPTTITEALLTEHSVLCSIDPHEPTPVHLPPNSIIGRIGTGRLRAITFDELRTLLADTGGQ